MNYKEKILNAEAIKVAKTRLISTPIQKELRSRIEAVKVPPSYSSRIRAKLTEDSPELNLRLDYLQRFNDKREKSVDSDGKSKTEYFESLESFLFQEANKKKSMKKIQEKLEDCLHGGDDVFLRKTITEAVVLRKFDGFLWVFPVKGEEFPVKVKEGWPGLEFSVGVGDVLRVFKPKKGQDGGRIDLIPELVCCYNIDLETTKQFLENLDGSEDILEDFLRCQAIWEYILNYSVTDEKLRAYFCKSILCICQKVASLQTPVQMSEMAKQFWYSFKGTKFLKEVLPGIIKQEAFQFDFDDVQVFVQNIMKVIPECAISVKEIVKNLYLKRTPENGMIFMQNLVSSLAENVTGAKDNIHDLQWNHRPLIPATTELLDFAPDWKSLPCIKVKKNDKDKDFKYSSDEEYLNTIFTLLREECFFNLKDGIGKYLKDGEFDSRNVMLYRISLVKAASDFCHEGLAFMFDVKQQVTADDKATSIDPDNSHWLLNGNLLCISLDASFRHPIWATADIKDREKLKKEKRVSITFCTEMNSLSDAEVISKLQKLNDKGDEAYMFESNTFYVAYGPPMDVLQHKECVPFKKQIVEVEKCTDQPPDYLKNIKTRPDWGIFFKNPPNRLSAMDYSYDKLLEEFRDLRNDPKCEPKMDKKQLDAVDQALCNKLTLIQGPPGTGKSYVGERLLQFFLSCLPEDYGPILVVTYKNFALDHFLEDCLTNIPNFESMLVRVGSGGEGQSEDLKSCKIFQLLKENRDKNRQGIHIDLERNLSNQLDSMKQQILYFEKQLRCANKYSNLAHVFIQEAEFKHLKSLIGDELDSMTRDGNDLWRVKHEKQILEMLKDPLSDWLPTKDKFLNLSTVYSNFGSSETKVSKEGSSSDEEGDANGETDPNSDNKERLGAFDEEEEQCTDEQENQLDTCQSNDDEDWVLPDIPYEKLGNFKSILNAGEIRELKEQERIQFVYALLRQHNNTISERFSLLTKEFTKKCKTKKELSDRLKIDILKKRRVIGMTVSGAAIRTSWLETIKPSVMIVEEAAEILEPQLVAIIPTSVEHLIMIGDQEQLKPQVSHYKLGRKCNLQTSLFERLIKGGLDYTQLNKQGRMTDDLAEVVRRLGIYEHYETRQEVVESNWKLPQSLKPGYMFFYAHTKPEKDGDGTHSKCNEYEAKKVVLFAKYLRDSKIDPSKITILCSYLAQVKYIKSILGKEGYSSVQEIHVTTIDSFQGKEKEIIILSLVRSGEGNAAKIGYLASMNRICVAVSRARCGLYLFGNKELLKKRSSRGWKKVIAWMEEKGCVGDLEKSFPFPSQHCGDIESDGPIGNHPSPSRSEQDGSTVTCGTSNVYLNNCTVGSVQIGDHNTTTNISDDKPREQQSPPMSSSIASPRGIQPKAFPIEETNKVDTPASKERKSMEETSKVLGEEMISTEETTKSDGPQAPEGDLLHDLDPRERSFYHSGPQSESPSERHGEATEISFRDPSLVERLESDGVNNRLPQQGTNCPVNNPVQEDTSTADSTHQGDNVDHHSKSVQEGDAGTPVQEEKNNTAYQESKTDCLESYPQQDTDAKPSDK